MKRIVLVVAALVAASVLQASPARAATLAVDPVPSSVRVGTTVYVTGTAPLLRTVVLQAFRGGKWVDISASSGTGQPYKFKVPTSYYGTRTMRIHEPVDLLGPAEDSATMKVVVRPSYTPRGVSSQYKLLGNGFRWNPCKTIGYHINLGGLGKSNITLITQALTKVSQATGLKFAYKGRSTKVPFTSGWYSHPPTAGLYIAFTNKRTVPSLNGLAGLGGESRLETTPSGGKVITTGGAILDKATWPKLKPGWRNGAARGSLLLHEIGHAMGLMHVTSKKETMYPSLGSWEVPRYGAGDLQGLNLLGADKGCIS